MSQIYIFFLILSLSFIGFSQPTTLVSYNFSGAPGDQSVQPTASTAQNLSATVISRGQLATGVRRDNGMFSDNWPNDNTLDLNDYFEFSVTPDNGYGLTLNNLLFADENLNNGAQAFAVRTSLDNFVADVATENTQTQGNNVSKVNRTINLSSISSSKTVAIRIYGYNRQAGGAASRIWGLTNPTTGSGVMELTGTVVPITIYEYNNDGWTPNNPESGVSKIFDPIKILAGDYTFDANVDCESITVAPGRTITVNSDVTITADNGVTLQSVSNNYSSLILDGVINGTINYSRFVNVIGSGTTGGNEDRKSTRLNSSHT